MKYADLTLDQRITLKGLFQTDKHLARFYAVMILWNFIIAIELFLNNNPSILKI